MLTKIFNSYMGFCQKVSGLMTFQGALFGGFLLCAAAPAVLAAGATPLSVITSFYSLFTTDVATGGVGLSALMNNAALGAQAWGTAISQVATAGLGAYGTGPPILEALGTAMTTPMIS